MDKLKIVDKTSYIVAGIALVFGFVLFFSDTWEFMKSLSAAFLLGGLVWVSYIMVRWLILAIRK